MLQVDQMYNSEYPALPGSVTGSNCQNFAPTAFYASQQDGVADTTNQPGAYRVVNQDGTISMQYPNKVYFPHLAEM